MYVAVKCISPNGTIATWFRGQIVDVTEGKGMVSVFLVDYGRQVTVTWMYIRKLQMQFVNMECQVSNKYAMFEKFIAIFIFALLKKVSLVLSFIKTCFLYTNK